MFAVRDPPPDGVIAGQIETALMRNTRVSKQCHVREREVVAQEITRAGELSLQLIERGIAALHQVRIELVVRLAEIDHLEAADGHIGLVAVLLPEHPGIHLRGCECIPGNEIAVAGEIAGDGVRLRKPAPALEVHRRHLPERVELEEIWRTAFAAHRVALDPAVRQAKIVAEPLPLQSIAGITVTENLHVSASLRKATEQQAEAKLSTVAIAERRGRAQNL